MLKITGLKARQIFDSRGNPTIECDLKTAKGIFRAAVPSGASTGTLEALELRDGGKDFAGKTVLNAVKNVNQKISEKVVGKDFNSQKDFDLNLIKLDGTENKSNLGANALLSVSLSFAKAFAAHDEMELFQFIGKISDNKNFLLPVPQLNVINGGKHAGMENDIQEHMIMPVKSKNFYSAMKASVESYHELKKMLKQKFGASAIALGDEGGFVPPIENTHDRLEIIMKAVEEAGYGKEILIALDSASSEFYKNGKYNLWGKEYSSDELVDYYADLVSTFKIFSIEDGMHEADWNGWQKLNSKLGNKIQIVGDDLLVTNVDRIKTAIEKKACNALLLKVNQIGTLTESIEAAKIAFENGWNVVQSHRSGETEDYFISDMVVGLGASQSKFGAPARSDRNAKYNQLFRIMELIGDKYWGSKI